MTGGPGGLDLPVLASLTGAHAALAEQAGRVARYRPDVCAFAGVPLEHRPEDWAALGGLVGPGALTVHFGLVGAPPTGWSQVFSIDAVQLVAGVMQTGPDTEAVVLSPDDVPEMLDLVARTQPGPFLSRTIEMGAYLGIRRDGALVAMAGERMHPPGHTEISAVCTDPAFRGQGLGSRLIGAVAHGVRARGETPFLHTGVANTTAIRLYESLGMVVRREIAITGWRAPGSATG